MSGGGKVILVVDDEAGMRDMLKWYLGQRGFEIRTASHGEEAARILAREPVDVIVTDLTMPRADGFKVMEAAKRLAPRAPVIAVSGFGTVETAVLVMRQGAYDFMLKPFDPESLVERIKEVAGGAP